MTDMRSILVVEDDPILKNLLGHTLAGKYETMYASDGNEAMTLIETHKPVLILLDLMLPTMDGFAVLTAIRARTDGLQNVPIIVVSNLGASTDIEKAKALGANDYLIKAEVAIEEIVAKMEAVLAATPPPADPATVPPALA
jgi:DNA-binding response OmpR family regulator